MQGLRKTTVYQQEGQEVSAKKTQRASDFEINLAICSELREIADERPESIQAKRIYRLLTQVQALYLNDCPPIKLTLKKVIRP